jgi:exodeoxyribonuclease-3
MRFLTWNIQSGGGRRVPVILEELERLGPDFVTLTEVTCNNLDILRSGLLRQGFRQIETTCSEGRTNSLLVASKLPFKTLDEPVDNDSERWLAVEIEALSLKVLSVHIPGSTDNKFGQSGLGLSGKKRKELFWDQVIHYAQRNKGDRVVVLGDFNTGLPEDAEGTPFELADRIRVLRLEKYIDTWRSLNPGKREYTWYSKRKNKDSGASEDLNGFRLDYVFVSNALRDCIISAQHVHSVRADSTSDHAAVVADLSLGDLTAALASDAEAVSRVEKNSSQQELSDDCDDVQGVFKPRPDAGQTVAKPVRAAKLGTGYFAQKPGDWTREEFIEAVEAFSDRAFLLKLLEIVDANDELPSLGPAPRLFFGKRPGGAMFVYQFGRRHPPYKFSIRKGYLMIAGCWTRFPQVEGDPGFADLASMLNLDEKSSAKAVPVAGLDADDVWEVGEKVSRAING